MRFWTPEPAAEPVRDPVAEAHAAALREAYARGRRDERARRSNTSLLAGAFSLAGLVGATLLLAAVLRGSFEGGDRIIEHPMATAAQTRVMAEAG